MNDEYENSFGEYVDKSKLVNNISGEALDDDIVESAYMVDVGRSIMEDFSQ